MFGLSAKRKGFALTLLLLFSLSGCLVRRRVTSPTGKPELRPLLTATKEDLISRIHQVSDPVRSFSMKVDMSPSIGSLYGGQITDYATIAGIVLYLKPDSIRVIGLDPVIHSTAFDMVSVGNDFRVSIPSKNRFVIGRNDNTTLSKNKFENLRPAAFLTAVLVNPPDPQLDIPMLMDDTNETKAVYMLLFARHEESGYRVVRNVYFDRHTLQISRQKTFDRGGNITSDIRYTNWVPRNGVPYPSTIEIQRPVEGYEVLMTVTDIKLNSGDVTPGKFDLPQPPGSQLRELK